MLVSLQELIWLVHPIVEKFPFRELSLCRSQNIPMGQEIQRKRKEPTERRTTQRFLMLMPKTDLDELSVNSWKCHYYTLIEPKNQRAARNIDCAMLNETQKSCNNSAKNFSTHESITKKAKKSWWNAIKLVEVLLNQKFFQIKSFFKSK